MLPEDFVDRLAISEIGDLERTADGASVARRQVIEHDDRNVSILEYANGVGPDITGSPDDENRAFERAQAARPGAGSVLRWIPGRTVG